MIKYFGKAPLCNKIASRGFFIKGFCFPLCCRCSSIIFSMIIFYFIFINLKIKNMVKELNKSIDLKFEELEDRLEMAQVAAGEVVRCNIGDVTR